MVVGPRPVAEVVVGLVVPVVVVFPHGVAVVVV